MAAAIRKALGVEAVLVEGRRGVFDVKLDGQILFSKHAAGRFPDDGEVEKLIAAKTA